MSRFRIGEEHFLLDGQPFRILSGAIHYFRVHPDLWADRIRKARQMGLNTVETYVAWNLHEPQPGAWQADGALDLARFLRTVADEGMYAIVRPGPYICAEFDNGGLPSWLFTDPRVGVRRNEPRYLAAVGAYLDRVHEIVAPLQIDLGGPVLLEQVENEYGAYGDDAEYLAALVERIRAGGITVPLTTVDQPRPWMLRNGSLPQLHRTASFGSRSPERLAVLREHQPTGPLMCSEYWDGWFDSWGAFHHTTSAEEAAADLDALLATGASVNLYMFHGGTNFGFTAGANDKGLFRPIVTSYDYDAPLDEAGRPTAKYAAFREVLGRYTALPADEPAMPVAAPVDDVPFVASAPFLPLLTASAEEVLTDDLPSFARLRHDAVLAMHRAALRTVASAHLVVHEPRDRVHVFADGRRVGILSREFAESALTLPPVAEELTLVVENQGRVDYGPRLGEDKGIIGGVSLDGAPLRGWRSFAVGGSDLLGRETLPLAEGTVHSLPPFTVARASFEVAQVADRFLDTAGWGKGVAWINGFCLGRYWSRPPQRTLYVPAPVLHEGTNELVVLEFDGAAETRARFLSAPELGPIDW
jgi:beta-galactosidase